MPKSYAQRGEDLRLLELLGKRDHGFYIDVGAWSPVKHSVSKLFYDLGWRGINVEPHPVHAAALRKEQPQSITIEAAVSDFDGYATFHTRKGRSALSTLDESLAQRFGLVEHRRVRTWMLDTICNEMCRQFIDDQEIDWLKVDAEGSEPEIIAGADWKTHRPRVVVVEAVAPKSTTPTHESWEPILLTNGYRLVHNDGLNRFYRRSTPWPADQRSPSPASSSARLATSASTP